MPPHPRAAEPRIFYGWWVAVAFSLIIFLSTGIRFAVGPFLKPVVGDLGIDRGTFSLVVSLSLFLYGVFVPLLGPLVDRWGSRVVCALGTVVMAVSMVIQTVMVMGAAVAAVVAWRRTTAAVAEARARAEAQVAELRVYFDRMAATVDDTARALRRGQSAVDDVMTDVRDAMGTVRNSGGSVAQVVTGPRAALALGLWRGIQVWRKRRAAQRVAAAATSEL